MSLKGIPVKLFTLLVTVLSWQNQERETFSWKKQQQQQQVCFLALMQVHLSMQTQ